jgi:hypothetical protein
MCILYIYGKPTMNVDVLINIFLEDGFSYGFSISQFAGREPGTSLPLPQAIKVLRKKMAERSMS